MKRILAAALSLISSIAFSATLTPVQLINPAGSSAGQAIVSGGAATAPAWGNVSATTLTGVLPVTKGGTNASSASGVALDNISGFSGTGFLTRTGSGTYAFQSLINGVAYSNLAQAPANTLLGNASGSTANVTTVTVTGCNGSAQALQWTNGSGFGCNSAIATSGANANITSLSGLTTALSVGQGGTGRATLTAHGVLLGEGTAAVNQTSAGTAGQVLTSGGASTDPAWGNPGQPYFQAYLSANQSFTAGTITKVQFNTKNYDSGTYYDNTTNYRFTPLIAGKYRVTVHVTMQGVSTAVGQYAPFVCAIYKNGATVATSQIQMFYNASGATLGSSVEVSATVSMNGTTDYIEGWGNVLTVGTTQFNGGSPASYIEASYIGP